MKDDFFSDLENELTQIKESDLDENNENEIVEKTSVNQEEPQKKQFTKKSFAPKSDNINDDDDDDEDVSNFGRSNLPPFVFPKTRPQYLPALEQWHTRITIIWGHNEVGKNMSMIEYWKEIILVDCWIQFPENNMLWAKYSLPDISPIIPLADKIKGILITHWHLDHIGWLKHILPALGFPNIYASKLTIGLIKKQLEESWMNEKVNIFDVSPDTDWIFSIGSFKIEFFRVNHNIPDSCGLYIETPNFKMVHTWDFKFDFTPSIDQPANLSKIWEIGSRWIDLLLSDSTNSLKEWFTQTEADIGDWLTKIISEAKWRIIIATFSSLIWRMQQIIEAAEKSGRSVYLNWRSMIENVRIWRELWYVKCKPGTIKRLTNKIDDLPDNEILIITTGSQWEELSWLHRMAYGEHTVVNIKPGDSVVLSSSPIVWNERQVIDLMNNLIRFWAILYTKDWMDIHTSWHASREEQKLMLNLIKPKNFIPVHGELFMRVAHKKTAMSMWVPEKNIFLTDNGAMIEIDKTWNIKKSNFKLKLEEIIVDGHGIWIANSHVIDARAQMMKAWIVVIIFRANEKSRELQWMLKIESRWLVYLDEVREVHRMIIKKSRSSYQQTLKDMPDIDDKDLIKIVRKDVETYLAHKIDREPMVIPSIVYV